MFTAIDGRVNGLGLDNNVECSRHRLRDRTLERRSSTRSGSSFHFRTFGHDFRKMAKDVNLTCRVLPSFGVGLGLTEKFHTPGVDRLSSGNIRRKARQCRLKGADLGPRGD